MLNGGGELHDVIITEVCNDSGVTDDASDITNGNANDNDEYPDLQEEQDDQEDVQLANDEDDGGTLFGDVTKFNTFDANNDEENYFDNKNEPIMQKDDNVVFNFNDKDTTDPARNRSMNHYPDYIMSRSDTEVTKRRSKILSDNHTTRFSATYTPATYHGIFGADDASDVDGLLDDVTVNDEDSGDITSSSHNGDVIGGDDITLIS